MATLRFGAITSVTDADTITVTLDGARVAVPRYGSLTPATGDIAWIIQEGRRTVLVGFTQT